MKLATIVLTLALLAMSPTVAEAKRRRRRNRSLQDYDYYGGSKSGGTYEYSGAKGGYDYGGGIGTPPRVIDGQCVICDRSRKQRPTSITFKYRADGQNSKYQDSGKASCRAGSYPPDTTIRAYGRDYQVSDGQEFTLQHNDMGAETYFTWTDGGAQTCYIHTSCSAPIVVGDVIGPFEVVGGNQCGDTPPQSRSCSDDECLICDRENKVRPPTITLQYVAGPGKTSNYQDASKATCRAGPTYPDSNTVSIGSPRQSFQVSDGTVFTIGDPSRGRLEANTFFNFGGGQPACSIHTSCSAPLVTGDQLGPFIIREGNTCVACVCEARARYENGVLNIDFNFGDAPPAKDDWIGIYPCEEETLTADKEFDNKVDYENVFEIGYNENEVYVNANPIWYGYACGSPGDGCQRDRSGENMRTEGTIKLDPSANKAKAPWAFGTTTELVPGCYKAVINRETIISGPPYPTVCKSWLEADKFIVM